MSFTEKLSSEHKQETPDPQSESRELFILHSFTNELVTDFNQSELRAHSVLCPVLKLQSCWSSENQTQQNRKWLIWPLISVNDLISLSPLLLLWWFKAVTPPADLWSVPTLSEWNCFTLLTDTTTDQWLSFHRDWSWSQFVSYLVFLCCSDRNQQDLTESVNSLRLFQLHQHSASADSSECLSVFIRVRAASNLIYSSTVQALTAVSSC